LLYYPWAVFVKDTYAYVACFVGDRLTIVDVSDVTNPSIVGNVTGITEANGVFVKENYAYVTAYRVGTEGGLYVVDVSDPTSPSIVGSVVESILYGAWGIDVIGTYAYIAVSLSDRFAIIDISDPTSPFTVGYITDGTKLNSAIGCRAYGKYAYVGASRYLDVIDISDPSNPTIVGYAYDIHLDGCHQIALLVA